MTSLWKWPILIPKELLSRLEFYVTRKTSFFLTVHVLKPKAAVPLYRSSLLANKKKQVLILLVHVLTISFPCYVTVSTKYKTADLNDSYSGSLVITVAVERRRRPAVLFSVPTPHKPTTDWASYHGLQKQRQILQVPTVVAKNGWCTKTTLKEKSLVHIFGMIACGKAHWSSTLHSAWLCTDSHAKGIWDSLWAKSRQSLDETTILEIKPPSTCIRLFLNPQLFRFFADPASVHTYSVNPQLSESALQRGNFWIRYKSGIVWTLILNHTSPSPNRWGARGRETRRVRGWRRMTFQTSGC